MVNMRSYKELHQSNIERIGPGTNRRIKNAQKQTTPLINKKMSQVCCTGPTPYLLVTLLVERLSRDYTVFRKRSLM